jgi:hypothetical protein
LIMSTSNPSSAGLSASRNNAGDESCARARGPTITKRVSDACAARCNRRKADVLRCCAQKISPPQLPVRKICSADHNASAVDCAFTCSSCSSGSPIYPRPSPFGICGGCSKAIGRLPATLRAGRRSLISPTPGCCTSRSMSAPTGQPPPGSSADSAGYPVSKTRPRCR